VPSIAVVAALLAVRVSDRCAEHGRDDDDDDGRVDLVERAQCRDADKAGNSDERLGKAEMAH